MNLSKVLTFFLANVALSSTKANETEDSAIGGLRGANESIEEAHDDRRLEDEPMSDRDVFCGNAKVGNGFCPDNPDDVCSKWGWCGTTENHKKNAAPRFFPRLTEDDEPTCGGGNIGNGHCDDGKFCSKWGYCGNTDKHYDQPAPIANIQLFREAAYMSRMAYFVDQKQFGTANCKDPNKVDALDYCEQKELGDDAVLVTKHRNKCFVAFRGTKGFPYSILNEFSQVEDWMSDAHQSINPNWSENEKGCRYRLGFNNAYQSMRSFIFDKLSECKAKCNGDGCPVVLTGHSQGGGAAVAASFDERPDMKQLFNDPLVVTFGAPPIAGNQEECESSTNPEKHFRIVMAQNEGDKLSCDPIAEHSRKKYTTEKIKLRYYLAHVTKQFTIEDKNEDPTYHLGNEVLLIKDGKSKKGKRMYQVAQTFGDESCFNYSAGTLQVLGTDDFVKVKKTLGTITGVAEDHEQPLHNIHTYNENLKDILMGNVGISDGVIEGSSCGRHWQCKDDLICNNNRCVAPNSVGV